MWLVSRHRHRAPTETTAFSTQSAAENEVRWIIGRGGEAVAWELLDEDPEA